MTERKFDSSSTQVNFPPDAARAFFDKQKSFVTKSSLYKPESGMGLSDTPHVTILYGIHSPIPTFELLDAIETYPKFTVVLGKVSLFKGHESDNPFDVVKVDVECPDLHVLNHDFKQLCEYSNDYPEYIPHATIAYVHPNTCDHLEGATAFKGLSFLAEHIVFSSKEGPQRHICLGRK